MFNCFWNLSAIKSLTKKDVQACNYSEMLEDAVIKYQKHALSMVDVIQKLINLSNEIKDTHNRAKELGLDEDGISFYDTIAENGGARENRVRQTALRYH